MIYFGEALVNYYKNARMVMKSPNISNLQDFQVSVRGFLYLKMYRT